MTLPDWIQNLRKTVDNGGFCSNTQAAQLLEYVGRQKALLDRAAQAMADLSIAVNQDGEESCHHCSFQWPHHAGATCVVGSFLSDLETL